jgi:UDP-glucose:(heptosyl)LPS alpha-1,3-glucosyltransferase
MKPLKLALIRQRYTPYGGAERFVARAMAALQDRGAQVTIVTRRWTGDGDALVVNPFYLGSLWRDWSFARGVCATLARHDFDLVQSHERIACCDVYRAGDGVHREWLAQRARIQSRWARLATRLNPYHRYTLAAEAKLFASPRLKAVICNSRMVQQEIQRHFGVAEDKLHVIYSGVDLGAFHPGLKNQHRAAVRTRLGIPDTAPVYLFVGSGFERKGLGALLHAFARAAPASHLMIVGADKHSARYQNQARGLGVAARTHFLGPQQDVKPYYGAADVFALPTLYDPFPNAALEAFACGLPVITSDKSGAAELVRAGENGFVCDALDVDAIARAMNALQGRTQLAAASAQARQCVLQHDLQTMSAHALALYRQLLQAHKV